MTLSEYIAEVDKLPESVRSASLALLRSESQEASIRMKEHFRPYPSADGSDPVLAQLNRRSGSLQDAIHSSPPARTSRGYATQIGVITHDRKILRYAETQEGGRTITAKRADKLAIPVAAGLNSDGTPRFKSIRDADAVYDEVKFTNKYIFGVDHDGLSDLLAIRRKRVVIPPRPFIGPEAEKAADNIADKLIDEMAGAF